MNGKNVLLRAVQKAIDGGWKCTYPWTTRPYEGDKKAKGKWFFGDARQAEGLIFNHDFARAIWGEKLTTEEEYPKDFSDNSKLCWQAVGGELADALLVFTGERWQYHLQMMVIADDPVKYLGENL